jgi:Cytochrome c554 and c-prime
MRRSSLSDLGRGYALAIPFMAIVAAAGVAACQGQKPAAPAAATDAAAAKPTVRLYVLSTVAGALEPCGCTKDQLGGVDHLAAYLQAQKAEAPDRLVVSAGPLLFAEPEVKGDGAKQDEWKAEALAQAAKELGLAAWTPGANDWALGREALARYREQSGAALLGKNVEGAEGVVVREVGGVKVGLVGVTDPKDRAGGYPAGVKVGAALDAMKAGVEEAKKRGAQVLVGLAALPRGEALRLADHVPELHVLVLGKPVERGDVNDGLKPPVLLGRTLVVETPNHAQAMAVVDLFVQPGQLTGAGPLAFADAGGVSRAEELISLSARIRELENRVNSWERDRTIPAKDLAARKADLDGLRAQKAKLEAAHTKVEGSFFRYSAVEVREKLGVDGAVAGRMLAYYKRVNAHNKEAFADRVPEPPAAGQAGYLGVEACSGCHAEERKVYEGTAHARAYATLQRDFKEYNLDCVSCHVTGYGKPGGSTVTHNERLQSVQCEVCHGPGALHAKEPKKEGLITRVPAPETCVSECHHPPHVEGFDALSKMQLILGPGHGR